MKNPVDLTGTSYNSSNLRMMNRVTPEKNQEISSLVRRMAERMAEHKKNYVSNADKYRTDPKYIEEDISAFTRLFLFDYTDLFLDQALMAESEGEYFLPLFIDQVIDKKIEWAKWSYNDTYLVLIANKILSVNEQDLYIKMSSEERNGRISKVFKNSENLRNDIVDYMMSIAFGKGIDEMRVKKSELDRAFINVLGIGYQVSVSERSPTLLQVQP